MPLYRKKPVVIEARLLTESNIHEIYEWIHNKPIGDLNCNAALDHWEQYCNIVKRDGMAIPTLEDGQGEVTVQHVATVGDYIIKGIRGEFYPCKPDIFLATYENA